MSVYKLFHHSRAGSPESLVGGGGFGLGGPGGDSETASAGGCGFGASRGAEIFSRFVLIRISNAASVICGSWSKTPRGIVRETAVSVRPRIKHAKDVSVVVFFCAKINSGSQRMSFAMK